MDNSVLRKVCVECGTNLHMEAQRSLLNLLILSSGSLRGYVFEIVAPKTGLRFSPNAVKKIVAPKTGLRFAPKDVKTLRPIAAARPSSTQYVLSPPRTA